MPVEVVVVRGHGLAAVLSREIVHDTPVVRYLDHRHPPQWWPRLPRQRALGTR
jgi:hypothetical protein